MAESSTPPPPEAVGEHRLARPPAVQLDARRVVLVGTILWFVAALALLPFWGWLGRHDHHLWLWTCLAGGVLGLLGYVLLSKHRREGRTL
ncbi:MAG: DUF2530 domain-containing protein [Jatrophihabitantaceae bacterium]